MLLTLNLFTKSLLDIFSDIRVKNNAKNLINSMIEQKTTKLKTLSKDTNEYERFHTLLNGELKNILSSEKLNELLGKLSSKTQSGKYCLYVIHDQCDIRKPESKVLENIGIVRDLSGKWVNGYSTYNIILVEPDSKKVHLHSSIPFSNKDFNFVSKKELNLFAKNKITNKKRKKEIEAALETEANYNSKSICIEAIKNVTKTLRAENKDIVIVHVFDRGFDDNEIFELISSLGDEFAIRIKSNRNANETHIGEKGNEVFLKLTEKKFENKEEIQYKKVTFKNKMYKNAKGIFEWDTIKIKDRLYSILRVRFYKATGTRIFKDDMLIISTYCCENVEMAIHIYNIYMQRPKIEGVFKFIKGQLGWEDFRVHDYESIKNIITLAFFVGAYFYEIEDDLIDNKYVIWIAKLGGGKGKVTKHFFMEGLKTLLILVHFEEFKKNKNLKEDQILQAIKMFSIS